MKKENKKRHCGGCNRELKNLFISSPVVLDELWERMLNHFNLSENRVKIGVTLIPQTPQYLCFECMEKALGRKFQIEDLKPLPFNLGFRLHYLHNVPFNTVVNIYRYTKQYIEESPKFSSNRLQRETDYMNGVLMPFTNPLCEGYAKALLSILSDEELKNELKRREKTN